MYGFSKGEYVVRNRALKNVRPRAPRMPAHARIRAREPRVEPRCGVVAYVITLIVGDASMWMGWGAVNWPHR